MTNIKITTENNEEQQKPAEVEDLKKTLKAADEYQKLKEENDKLESEYLRQMELKAKISVGGRGDAGKLEKSEEEKIKEEAAKILSAFEPE